MAEEDLFIDTPIEPQAITPLASLIDMEIVSPRNRAEAYRGFIVKKVLNKGKFPVFLVTCQDKVQNYAMKAFPVKNSRLDKCFQNEIRFASLCHPNVIRTVFFEPRSSVQCTDKAIPSSVILTEYAPNGDFYDLIDSHRFDLSEKLVRTYFRQLINGLEYIHNRGIVHLDIKPENLLIGSNYELKITDFDLSCFLKDKKLLTKGTEYYRAPEMIEAKYFSGTAADIYSAGIILFVLRSEGRVPHTEHATYKGIDLLGLLNNNINEFWRKHCEIQKRTFSQSFKELVNNMLKNKPEERWTISQIKNSRWYNEPVYTDEELKKHMKALLSS